MATIEDYKYLFKVVLVGNAGVGKTCLVRRFTQGMFPPGQGATIGVDFMIKTVEVEGEKIKLQIWDTAGQERFRSITQSYYRSAHALILVYDVSNQPTFDCCPEWLREIEEYASPKVLKILVGNKVDRDDREIPTEIGEEFSNRHGMYFLETSAKSSNNVEKLFTEIAQDLLQLSTEELLTKVQLIASRMSALAREPAVIIRVDYNSVSRLAKVAADLDGYCSDLRKNETEAGSREEDRNSDK